MRRVSNECRERSVIPPMVFDESLFMARLEGDESLGRDIIKTFLAECPSLLERVRQAARQRDAVTLERAAHALKGSLGDIAAPPAFDAAQALEQIGREGDLDGSEEALVNLEESLHQLERQLRHVGDSIRSDA